MGVALMIAMSASYLACLWLFTRAFMDNWKWMTGWIVIGFVIYFGYSRSHSKLNK